MATKLKTVSNAVPYFKPEALKFLRDLARHNDREWFQPRKAVFESELKEPMLAVVRKVTDAMLDFAPVTSPNSRLSCQIRVTSALDGLVVRVPVSQR